MKITIQNIFRLLRNIFIWILALLILVLYILIKLLDYGMYTEFTPLLYNNISSYVLRIYDEKYKDYIIHKNIIINDFENKQRYITTLRSAITRIKKNEDLPSDDKGWLNQKLNGIINLVILDFASHMDKMEKWRKEMFSDEIFNDEKYDHFNNKNNLDRLEATYYDNLKYLSDVEKERYLNRKYLGHYIENILINSQKEWNQLHKVTYIEDNNNISSDSSSNTLVSSLLGFITSRKLLFKSIILKIFIGVTIRVITILFIYLIVVKFNVTIPLPDFNNSLSSLEDFNNTNSIILNNILKIYDRLWK